jgi:hypothetical protein
MLYKPFGFLLLSISLFVSCKPKNQIILVDKSFDSTVQVSSISLADLSNKKKSFEGKYITTAGKFWFEFENVAICESGVFSNEENCYWLDFNKKIIEDIDKLRGLSGEHVILKGKLNLKDKGHFNSYQGTIDSVYFIQQE